MEIYIFLQKIIIFLSNLLSMSREGKIKNNNIQLIYIATQKLKHKSWVDFNMLYKYNTA